MTILFFLYIMGFGAIAIYALQTTQCKKSPAPLLFAIIAGILWPIGIPIGFCVGFCKAYKKDKEKKNSP